jgi:TonB-like protein
MRLSVFVLGGFGLVSPLAAQTYHIDSIVADSGLIEVSSSPPRGVVQIRVATPTGRFSIRADSATSAAWGADAAVLKGSALVARMTQPDATIHSERVVQMRRLSNDSASAYELAISNGSWDGRLVLADSTALQVFASVQNPPTAPPVQAIRIASHTGAAMSTARRLEFFDFQVTRQARSDRLVTPGYPEELRRAHVEGSVLMQFVVDTTGLADPSTLSLIKSSHPLFALNARSAVLLSKYHPAMMGNYRVRQLVQQPFAFAIQ